MIQYVESGPVVCLSKSGELCLRFGIHGTRQPRTTRMSNVEPGPVDFVEGAASFAVEYSLKYD